MKTSKVLFIFLLFTFAVLFTVQSVSAGCAIRADGSDPLDPNPQAKGTKYIGPLTIYYDENDNGSADDQICWFVRLRKGSTLYSFAECWNNTVYPDGSSDFNELNWLQPAINRIKMDFFLGVVIPEIYDCTAAGGDCPPAFLKSYDQDVGLDDGPNPTGVWDFWVMDITVAVQD